MVEYTFDKCKVSSSNLLDPIMFKWDSINGSACDCNSQSIGSIPIPTLWNGFFLVRIAQLVERRTENP
jgi:hypothetical protein